MDTKIKEFRISRLQALANKEGGNATLGRKLGLKTGAYIGQMLKGYRPITEKFIQKAEEATRQPGWFSSDLVASQNVEQEPPKIVIPMLAAVASMGTGENNYLSDAIVGGLSVSPIWVEENLKPVSSFSNLRFLHAFGDSMFPTFTSGDILLIDSGIKSVDVDGIYVLEAQTRLFIKRVTQSLNGHFSITSDNPKVKTVDVLNGDQEVIVHGRVLGSWAWRRF